MKTIHNFEELRERLRQGEPCRVAAIEATDSHSSEAVETAVREGWAKVTNLTTGDPQRSADEDEGHHKHRRAAPRRAEQGAWTAA